MTRQQLSDEQIAERFVKKKPHAPAAQDVADQSIDQDRFAEDMAAMRHQQVALTVARQEQNERVTALALELNYQGSTDPSVLENSARDAIRRIGMGIFELGGYLLLLQKGCEHGEFLAVLERVGVNYKSANKYMAVTRRFANVSTSRHLEGLGFSKMAELLPLDDSQLDDLVDEGQTGELALDDVSRMSVKELRAAVRKERAEAVKHKNQVQRLTEVNTELHEEARLIKRLPPDQALAKIKAEAGEAVNESIGRVRGRLRQALLALNDAPDHPSKVAFMASLLGPVYVELDALRDEFGLPLAADTKPEWERWAEANPVSNDDAR